MILFLNSFCSAIKSAYCAIALLLVLFSANASFAQQKGDDDVDTVEINLVRLNVGVVNKQGQAITSLTKNDFTVYEDDVKQGVQSFETTEAPFSVVMLLDISGSTLTFRQSLRLAALRFVEAISPKDRVAVIGFNGKTEVFAEFTTDRSRVVYGINRVEGQSGPTHFYKALSVALEKLSKEGNRRKAIVVLTDGIDTELQKDDRPFVRNAKTNDEAIASINAEANPKLATILNTAAKQGVTVYPLALPTGDPKRLPDASPLQVALYTAARERMKILANRTGGRLNVINNLGDMGMLYAEVAADLRTLYSISYQSSNAGKRDGKWRAIRIEVSRPELIARTRPGYYAK
jgi:VWFA-related protein